MLGFRVWDFSKKEMYYNGSNSNGVFIINMQAHLTLIMCEANESVDMFDYVPMQSTGLKDCNGIEIFEEDVLIDGHSYFQVSSIVDFLLAMGQDEEAFIGRKSNRMLMFPIIGNRFEQPELLERLNDQRD